MLVRPYFAELFDWVEKEISIAVGCELNRFQIWFHDNNKYPISFMVSIIFYLPDRENSKSKVLKLIHPFFKFGITISISRFNNAGLFVSYFTITFNDSSFEKLYLLDKLAYNNLQLSFSK